MRTTLEIADPLIKQARDLSGISRISDLVREGLAALVEREAKKRLIALGGSDRYASAAARDNRGLEVAETPRP